MCTLDKTIDMHFCGVFNQEPFSFYSYSGKIFKTNIIIYFELILRIVLLFVLLTIVLCYYLYLISNKIIMLLLRIVFQLISAKIVLFMSYIQCILDNFVFFRKPKIS